MRTSNVKETVLGLDFIQKPVYNRRLNQWEFQSKDYGSRTKQDWKVEVLKKLAQAGLDVEDIQVKEEKKPWPLPSWLRALVKIKEQELEHA